jgi:hypothetical protein
VPFIKQLPDGLDAASLRFNQRFDGADLVARRVVDACRDKAAPERVIRHP